jgi:RNA polymerase sigma-70 factor, ECF subfamily
VNGEPVLNSADTIRRVLDGDKDAFREIVAEFGPCIRAFLAGHLGDPTAVDDLAQEVFIAAFEKLRTLAPDSDLGAWLKVVARNRLAMHYRRVYQHGTALDRLRIAALEALQERLCTLQQEDGVDTVQRLRICLDKLPDHVRDVVRARHLEHERVTSIARRLQSSVTAISSLLFRGRKLLEECLSGRAAT